MARPRLKYKIQRNGNSIKFFEDGVYVDSIPLKELGQFMKERKSKNPMGELTQKEPREECATKVGYDPKPNTGVYRGVTRGK